MRREVLALVIVAVLVAAVFLIHPLIQGQLTTTPERAGTPPQSETEAQEPASPTPPSQNGQPAQPAQ
jgi:hypothetical protein